MEGVLYGSEAPDWEVSDSFYQVLKQLVKLSVAPEHRSWA